MLWGFYVGLNYAQGWVHDLMAYLATNEGLTRVGILVDQVCDRHCGAVLYSISALRLPRR